MLSHALKVAARAGTPQAKGLVVLIYHRVGAGTASAVDLPLDAFRRQLAWLTEHRTVVTLDAGIDALRAGANVDDWTVITFDDGTVDFAECAVPALVEARVPATLYASTGFVDSQQPFPWGAPPLTWSALRDAASTGLIAIGSHTHTHRLLDRCDAATIAEELDRSIERIGAEIGHAPAHFAYPKAVAGSAVANRLVRERFSSAALAGTRPNRSGQTDVHRLARTPVQTSDRDRYFSAKANGGMRFEDDARRVLNRIRYRGAEV